MASRTILLWLILCSFVLAGCSSWAARMFTRSMARLDDPIEPAPRMVATPVLPETGLAVSWIGHATTLFQIHDKVFLTDPLFTNTVGIVVKRYVKPGLDPAGLSRVDYTLISHTHFDHFSYGSLEQIPKDGILIVPNGAMEYTPEFSFRQTRALEPWEGFLEDGVRITAVPVQHFSGRYGFDIRWMRDRGFTGYVVEYRGTTVFFGGDTGYHPELFKEIGRRYSIDLALLPIGPGASWEIGSRIHVHPRGALMIARDLNARFMVPIHHRTLFYGSEQDPSQSIETFRVIAREMMMQDRIIDLEIGEQRVLIPATPAITGE